MTWSSQSKASLNCSRSRVEFFIGVPPAASPILARCRCDRPATLLPGAPEAEHHLGDAAYLDLFRTFRDPIAPVVPVDVLERHVASIADASVHLDRLVRRVTHQPVRAIVAHRYFVADLHVVVVVQFPRR